MIVKVSLLSKKWRTGRTLPRAILYNFSEATMGVGEGVSQIAAKVRYKRRDEFVDDPKEYNFIDSFDRNISG